MTHPIWPDESRREEGVQHVRDLRSSSLPQVFLWCTCGAPWINGACGRMPGAGHLPDVPPAPLARRRLAWGPFAMAMVCTSAVVALLIGAAWWLLGLGRLWAALLGALLLFVAFACAVVGYASGIAALRQGRDAR